MTGRNAKTALVESRSSKWSLPVSLWGPRLILLSDDDAVSERRTPSMVMVLRLGGWAPLRIPSNVLLSTPFSPSRQRADLAVT